MASHSIYALKGIDSSANKILLPKEFASFAVNTSFRGSQASSRPPLLIQGAVFPYDDGESTFKFGNTSGTFSYLGTNNLTQSYLIKAVGDSIFAGLVSGQTISWRRIYKGIDPKWQMSFFCQADRFLIWQNGKDLPLYWDGLATTMKYCKDAPKVENPMPIGNIMVYAHGRIFVATEENLVFASNFAYSNGLEGVGVFNWTETQYFNDGDGFGAVANFGRITGAGVMQKIPDANGHGPVIFFQERGAFAIDAAQPRPSWINNPNIQQIVLTGRGCSSPFSVVSANGDIWYRCHDKTVSSFKRELGQQEQWANKSLSKEVSIFTSYDAESTLLFSFGMFLDNRLLMGVGSRNEPAASEEFGYHRYCVGLVSLDLDDGSTVTSDEAYTWDGLWTGPRITGMAELIVSSEKTGFVFSFDSDGENRVYRVGNTTTNDITSAGEKRIQWSFINEGLFIKPGSTFDFSSTKVKFFNARDETIKLKQSFSAEDYEDFQSLPYKERPGRFCQVESKPGVCFPGTTSAPLAGVANFKMGCNEPRIGTTASTSKGEWFRLLTEGEGAMSIRYIQAFADESPVDQQELEAQCIDKPIDNCGYAQESLNYSFP